MDVFSTSSISHTCEIFLPNPSFPNIPAKAFVLIDISENKEQKRQMLVFFLS